MNVAWSLRLWRLPQRSARRRDKADDV